MDTVSAGKGWLADLTGISSSQIELVRMKGSTSSSVHLVQCINDIKQHGQCYVLRVLDNKGWLAEEPDLAAHEAAALTHAYQAGLPAPQVVGYSNTDVGFGAPVVLMTYVEGSINLQPQDHERWLSELAQHLAKIHHVRADDFPWSFRSWVAPHNILAPPEWSGKVKLWRQAFEFFRCAAPIPESVFIHRDYHPMNVLWHQDSISGVVDWINACRGPAGVDVAHCRVNLALMYGHSVANRFLELYTEVDNQFRYQPYWDLDAIFDMCLPEPTFYAPWRDFGLGDISVELLKERTQALLESVLVNLPTR